MHQEMCEKHLMDALDAADRLLKLAGEGDVTCDHDDCLVLDGIIRDCALQIRRTAVELEGHIVVESYKRN